MRGLLACAAMMSLGFSLVGCSASVNRIAHTEPSLEADVGASGLAVEPSTPVVVGVGGGIGSQFATMGVKGFAGTQHFLAEVAFGTEPFVWRGIYAAGGSLLLRDPQSRIRPKLSVLWKSNASSVVVWEKEQEGKVPGLQEYDPFPGIAILAGMLVRPIKNDPGSVEMAVGWRTPFDGMGAVERRAREYADRYRWVGSDVATPRWDHFTFSLGIHYPLGWR